MSYFFFRGIYSVRLYVVCSERVVLFPCLWQVTQTAQEVARGLAKTNACAVHAQCHHSAVLDIVVSIMKTKPMVARIPAVIWKGRPSRRIAPQPYVPTGLWPLPRRPGPARQHGRSITSARPGTPKSICPDRNRKAAARRTTTRTPDIPAANIPGT